MTNKSTISTATAGITKRYLENIAPYELIIDSIALQNRQIYELQKKFIQMTELVSKLEPVTAEDEELLKTREKELIMERKLFMEEALVENQLQYKQDYELRKNQLEEEIHLLETDIEIKGGNKINIFMNLKEGILGKLLDENRGNQDATSNIKYWKQAYERSKRSQN